MCLQALQIAINRSLRTENTALILRVSPSCRKGPTTRQKMQAYRIEIRLYRTKLLNELQQEKLPWTDGCGDICCTLSASSDAVLKKPTTFFPWINFARHPRGACVMNVRTLTLAQGGSESQSHVTPLKVYHVTEHGLLNEDLNEAALQKSPLPILQGLVHTKWVLYNDQGGLSRTDINSLFEFMHTLSFQMAGLLVGKQCCICFGPRDIGNEIALSMGPCTDVDERKQWRCQQAFENPSQDYPGPTLDKNIAPLNDWALNFLITAFVAHLKLPRMYEAVSNKLTESNHPVAQLETDYDTYIMPLLLQTKLPLRPKWAKPPGTWDKMLEILQGGPQGHPASPEGPSEYGELVQWIRRTHHGFLYHVDFERLNSQELNRLLKETKGLGTRRLILVKPSSETRMAAFH